MLWLKVKYSKSYKYHYTQQNLLRTLIRNVAIFQFQNGAHVQISCCNIYEKGSITHNTIVFLRENRQKNLLPHFKIQLYNVLMNDNFQFSCKILNKETQKNGWKLFALCTFCICSLRNFEFASHVSKNQNLNLLSLGIQLLVKPLFQDMHD